MNVHAIALALRGLPVFELAPGAKYPADKGWQERATDDPIKAGETIPDGSNVGVSTAGLVVIDVDAGKGGLESLEILRGFGEIPRTFTVRSARGGLHLYFRPKNGEKFRSRAHRLIKQNGHETETFALAGLRGIDIRAEGGLVVGPGSTFEGKPYGIADEAPIAEFPEFVAELARAAAPKPRLVAGTDAAVEVDQADAIVRATGYLMSAAPAIEGQGGDNHTIVIANRVMDFGVSPDTAAELMAEHWDPRCLPPWGLEDLQRKCHSAAKSRQDKIGREVRDDVFGIVEAPPVAPPASLLRFPSSISLAAIVAQQDRELIAGLIPARGMGSLYGASGAGKTFIALEMAFAIARGEKWHGRRVRRACVLYVGLEGETGLKKRILAAEQHYGEAGQWFAWLAVPVLLARNELGKQGAEIVIRAANELKAITGADECLIMVDTLARAMSGDDENSAEAMSFLVEQRIAPIERGASAAVVLIHHSGKSGDIRGSTVLRGAADFLLRAERNEKTRTLIAEKVKDGEEGPLFNYNLKTVRLKDEHGAEAKDSHGQAVTTCIIDASISARIQSAGQAATQILLQALTDNPDLNLSPNPKAKNYAARWLEQNRGVSDYTEAEFGEALPELLIGPFDVEKYDNRGRPAERVIIRPKIVSGDAAFT